MPRTVTNLKGYIESVHGKNPNPEDYLFFSPVGNRKEKLTQPAIAKRIKKYAEALSTLEVEKETSLPKKWKMADGSLSEFLGLPR